MALPLAYKAAVYMSMFRCSRLPIAHNVAVFTAVSMWVSFHLLPQVLPSGPRGWEQGGDEPHRRPMATLGCSGGAPALPLPASGALRAATAGVGLERRELAPQRATRLLRPRWEATCAWTAAAGALGSVAHAAVGSRALAGRRRGPCARGSSALPDTPAGGSASVRQRAPPERRHAAALRLLEEQIRTERREGCADPLRPPPEQLRRGPQGVSALGPHVPGPGFDVRPAPDATGFCREYLYRSDGQRVSGHPLVDCLGWDSANMLGRRRLVEDALRQLRASGYVVLEGLLPQDRLLAAGEAFRRYKESRPQGVTFGRMRARRDMTVPPFEGVWTEDWLTRHPLVLALLARHLRNSLDAADEKSAESEFAHWVADGAQLDQLQTGPLSSGFPVLDLMVVVDTPPGAPAQTRHRDTILPGPCASLGVHIPLTPLQLEPLNGAIGFSPGSHRLLGEGGAERDVVGAVPLGSVILYDSFTEHHGLENASASPRAALFSWFRVPGVYTGHTEENFGQEGLELTMRFRRHLQERLVEAVEEERGVCPGGAPGPFGRVSGPLAEWGEERVCFGCNATATAGAGAPSGGRWFCDGCWSGGRAAGQAAPRPSPDNVAEPWPDPGRFAEEPRANAPRARHGELRHHALQSSMLCNTVEQSHAQYDFCRRATSENNMYDSETETAQCCAA